MAWGDSGIVLPSYTREPVYVPKDAARVPWRLCTNFASVRPILDRFGGWPDYLVQPVVLEALYSGEAKEHIPRFTIVVRGVTKPCFPYLDEAEGAPIQRAFESAKPDIYPGFRSSLEEAGSSSASPLDRMLLVVQTLLVFWLRHAEREAGIWERRSSGQKLGAVFALGRHVPVAFTRVNAFVAANGMRLCFPWGGPYKEYGRILPMMEDPHTGWVLQTADEELHVLTAGLTLRPLTLLDLVDTSGLFRYREQQAKLNVGSLGPSQVVRALPVLTRGIRQAARGATQVLGAIVDLWESSRYSYLEGPGDYLEMAYAVLEGLLFQWALEDGLLSRPPDLTFSGENLVVRKSFLAQITGRKAEFPGICMLRDADSVWESLLESGQVVC